MALVEYLMLYFLYGRCHTNTYLILPDGPALYSVCAYFVYFPHCGINKVLLLLALGVAPWGPAVWSMRTSS